MKPSPAFKYLAKVGILLFAAIIIPLFLSAQTKDKKTTPPPPQSGAPAKPAPAPAPQQHPVQQPQQQHTGQPQQPHTGQPQQPHTGQPQQPHTGQPQQPHTGQPQQPQRGTNVTKMPDGKTVERKSDGSSVQRDKSNRVTGRTTREGHKIEYNQTGQVNKVVTRSGSVANFDSRGKVSTIKTANGMTITQSPGGIRRVEGARVSPIGEHYRVVSTGARGGYVEHTFQRGGHEYVRRTYVYGERRNVYVYRSYYYGGRPYYYYVSPYYYYPSYYGWAYNPWAGPVYYNWGWYGSPWYAPYGYYFAPYPVYSSAAFWLTDYMIAENLRAAYESQAAASGEGDSNEVQPSSAGEQAQSNSVTLTPEVKQMIAEEVKAQLAAEQAAATQGNTSSSAPTSASQQPPANIEQVPPALDPSLRVFIVATNLDVTVNGQPCSLSAGDVLMRTENAEDQNHSVGVNVVSSKRFDCSMGTSPRVQVADLQEMHNHFREQIDTGLKTLADNQGKNGIPSGPAANPRQNPDGRAAEDLTAAADLQKQQQDAEQAEKEVQQASSLGNGNGR